MAEERFRSLTELGRRDGIKRVGRKAYVLGQLTRAGIAVPRAWVLEARHFEAFCERVLPRKHDLRSLIKLSGTRIGDERCGRAYEEMMAAELDEELLESIAELWEAELAQLPAGVAVRPSLAASGARVDAAGRHLHSRVGLVGTEGIAEAIRAVWASSVLAWSVAGYAEAQLRDASVAILLQEAVGSRKAGILTRTASASGAVGSDEWHLGVLLEADDDRPWQRRAQLLLPMSLGRGGEEPPKDLARLRDALEPDGFEQLIEIGEVAVRELGEGTVVHFVVERDERCTVYVLSVDASPRWLPLRGGDASTTWSELTLGGRTPEPPSRLTQSVMERVVASAIDESLELLRCRLDEDRALMCSWSGRSYLNLDAMLASLRDVPLLAPEDLLRALGGVSDEQLRSLAGRAAASGRSMLRMPLVARAALSEALSLDRDMSRVERGLERTARGLADLDVGILPSDAIGTTLASTQTLLERSAELWLRCVMTQLAHQIAIRTLIGRHLEELDPLVGMRLSAGDGELFAPAMVRALEQVVEMFQRDAAAAAALRDPRVRVVTDLPDGLGRGALGQFVARYGDLCFSVFELARPRWREDARELMTMIALLLDCEGLRSVDERLGEAHAAADAELARYEPALSAIERHTLRRLLDRLRTVSRRRESVDRLVLRALVAVRRVVLDIDRRLRRIDPELTPNGPFHCSADRLRASLKSGRPELSRVISMRDVERAGQRGEPAPPLGFVASPPRGGIPLVHTHELRGIGVSAGVVEGPIRVARGVLPERLAAGEILVVSTFEAAHAPLALACGGVIADGGGSHAVGAEALRELGVPAVFSVAHATLLLQDGEQVRLDGERGVVERQAVARDAQPLSISPPAMHP